MPCSRRFLKLTLLHRKQSGAFSSQVVEAQDDEDDGEHVFKAKDALDDELEADYQEAVAMMTVAKQRSVELDRARQFFQEPQSLEGCKAQLDMVRNFHVLDVGNWAIDDCPAKGKVVNWRKPKSSQFLQSLATSLSHEREQCATTSSSSGGRGAEARALDEGVCVTPGTKEDCSSKLAGELCTISCVSGYSNSVNLPQIFLGEFNESLFAHLRAVIAACSDTQLLTGDTGTAGCPPSCVFDVGDTEQALSCQIVLYQEHSLSASLRPVEHQRLRETVGVILSVAVVPLWEIRLYGVVRRTIL